MAKTNDKYIPRLFTQYKKEYVPYLMKRFGYKNPMQVPRIEKITLNIDEMSRRLDTSVPSPDKKRL